MSLPIDKIRPNIRAITAYNLEPLEASVNINQNENPFGFPQALKDEVLRRAREVDWARYPDFVPSSLTNKIAKYTGWMAEGIMVGNGSNEMIQSVVNSIIEKGCKAALPEPTFSVYRQVLTVAGGEIFSIPLSDDLTFNIPRLVSKTVTVKPDLTIICSPNNPTGCTISSRDLASLLRNSNGIVVADQAYMEFGGDDFIELLPKYKNLVILRTFSKAMAMGGLRVGYCLASPELIREFTKAKMPYSLNFFSLLAAEVALDNIDILRSSHDAIKAEQQRLFKQLQNIKGLKPIPSAANFFLVKTVMPPSDLFKQLLQCGILVRDVSKAPMLSDCIRVSVGTPKENDRLIDALKDIF